MRSFQMAPRPVVPDGIEVPEAALVQDGVFTRSQARLEGWSDDRQRRLIRLGLWVPVARGVMRHSSLDAGPWPHARAVHLTAGLVVSHETAGAIWGLAVDPGLHGIGHVRRIANPVTPHRLPLKAGERVWAGGLQLTTPTRTLTDLLCALPESAAVAMATDALRRGLLSATDLRGAATLAHGRTGAPRAREVAHSCRWEPHSLLEWRFHGIVAGLGTGWRFNVDVFDRDGFVGRVDAVHEPSGTVVELDSRRFHGPERYQPDRTRDQRLTAMGYAILRFTWEDVELRFWDVTERIRRTIALRTRRPTPTAPTPPTAPTATAPSAPSDRSKFTRDPTQHP